MSFFTVFGLWGKNSGLLAQKLQKDCPNCNLCVQKFSVENLIPEKTFTIFSSTDQKFCGLCQQMLSKRKFFSKVIFFLGKNSCLPTEVEREGFWCAVRTSGRFVKTALYVSEWDVWLNCFFYEIFEFRHCFPNVGRTFGNIGAKISEKLSKVHSTWTTNFSRKVCFLKKIFTLTNLASSREKICRILSESLRPVRKTTFYTRSGELLA